MNNKLIVLVSFNLIYIEGGSSLFVCVYILTIIFCVFICVCFTYISFFSLCKLSFILSFFICFHCFGISKIDEDNVDGSDVGRRKDLERDDDDCDSIDEKCMLFSLPQGIFDQLSEFISLNFVIIVLNGGLLSGFSSQHILMSSAYCAGA